MKKIDLSTLKIDSILWSDGRQSVTEWIASNMGLDSPKDITNIFSPYFHIPADIVKIFVERLFAEFGQDKHTQEGIHRIIKNTIDGYDLDVNLLRFIIEQILANGYVVTDIKIARMLLNTVEDGEKALVENVIDPLLLELLSEQLREFSECQEGSKSDANDSGSDQ